MMTTLVAIVVSPLLILLYGGVLGEGVEVLARVPEGEAAGRIVAVRQGRLLATSFHPEVSGPEVGDDDRVHALFVDLVTQS